ncbi:hypothetical protein A9Q91_01905 [Candidatus Gracilibacteria bacterium 28_42_T64]|nr:hypothetical protein A9Q91_01905 [Candidatus Gracilibacteria bacterium 28_42_T64]
MKNTVNKYLIGAILLLSFTFTSVNAECNEGVDGCLSGWNHTSNTGSIWNNWTWFNPMSEFGGVGFMINEDNPLWSGPAFNWANGGRIRSFSKGANDGAAVTAAIDPDNRAPTTTVGSSFKVVDLPESTSNGASWWMWYDRIGMAARGLTNANTDRMSFYIKTEDMEPLSTPTGINIWGYHVGTYLCWDEGCNGGGSGGEGPGNQHYYHYLGLNPGAWIHVELDQHPQHRRDGSGPVLGNNPSFIESGKNYFENMSRFYMEIRSAQTDTTTMHIDEMEYYSTQDSVEPNQNDESVTSVWVGNWRADDYWEIGFADNSFGEDSMNGDTWSTFEIKWSTSPITNANYDSATLIEPMFYTGDQYTDKGVGAIRRSDSWERGVWTRFELPDSVEIEGNKLYFAIKDISIIGTGAGNDYPWNKNDLYTAPTDNIRIIDYVVGPIVVNPLEMTTTEVPTAILNSSYSEQISIKGGVAPHIFSTTSSLPAGVTLSNAGLLSGTPTELGIFNIEVIVDDSNSPSTQITKSFTLMVNPPEVCNDGIDNDGNGKIDCADYACTDGCSQLLVDFGNSAINDTFSISGWNTVFKDTYTGYYNQGMTNTAGTNKDYNYQGVSGSSMEFAEGDRVLLTWYNNTSSQITFTPRISFDDNDRPVSGVAGTWYSTTQGVIEAGSYGVTEYEVTSASAGNYTLVNTNVNYEHNTELILDKISLIDAGATGGGTGTGATDITAPVLSNGFPSGEQISGTTNTTLSISTDENAFCKYSTVVNTTYGSMINSFSTTGAQSHTVSVGGLTDGVSYTYYVRCIDGDSNENTNDYIISFSVSEAGTPTTSTGLIHNYQFDENTGTVLGDGFGGQGTISNGSWKTGLINSAVDFDNTTISLGNMDVTGNGLTISAWVNPDTFAIHDARIISKTSSPSEADHYWMMSTQGESGRYYPRFRLKSDQETVTLVGYNVELQAGIWQQITVTYDQATMKIYVNGVEAGSSTAANGPVATNATIEATIGANPDGSRNFDGSIDELKIYDEALSAVDVLTDYNDDIATSGYTPGTGGGSGGTGTGGTGGGGTIEGPNNPLAGISDLKYTGAFIIPTGTYGVAGTPYSEGKIAYNPDNHSLFLSTVDSNNPDTDFTVPDSVLGEFSIPNISMSEDRLDLSPAVNIQGFIDLYDDAPASSLERISGMYYKNGELFVNGLVFYDASANGTDTSLVIRDANAMGSSQIDGIFKMEGAARAAGWISDIPSDWQTPFGATQISGNASNLAIDSRNSMGPSAFTFDIDTIIGNNSPATTIATTTIMNYPLNEYGAESHAMYPQDKFPNLTPNQWIGWEGDNYESVDYNNIDWDNDGTFDHDNDLWTSNSHADYGFIIPGTNTYAVFGSTGGAESGIGYKVKEEDRINVTPGSGNCAGPCTFDGNDTSNFYWFFDVDDMIAVKSGVMQAHEVRPYSYGEMVVPFERRNGSLHTIKGGSYDATTQTLYLSLSKYLDPNPPTIVTYNVDLSNNENNTGTGTTTGTGTSDTTSPFLSNGTPSGEQVSGTTNVTLSVSTNENAFCKYSTTSNIAYGSMTNSFSTTGGQSHTISVGGFTDGNSYRYYVRCIDGSLNENASDYVINFSIAEPSSAAVPPENNVCLPLAAPSQSDTIINVVPSQALQLRDIIMGAQSDTTIYLADGTYNVGSNFRLEFTNPRVTVRSLSGNRDAVIVDGGYNQSGAAEIFYVNIPNITIADITIQKAYYHPIHVTGNGDNANIYNVKIIDGAEQFIKINPEGTNYPDNGRISCSYFELTDAGSTHTRNGCYTGGIDAHSAQGWFVKNNTFKDIYCRDNSGIAEHAVHFWSQSRDTHVEGNLMINNARGIGFGLGATPTTGIRYYADQPLLGTSLTEADVQHIGGVIQNNIVYGDNGSYFDTGIGVEKAHNPKIYNNTVYTNNNGSLPLDARFTSTTAEFINNIYYPNYFSIRDGATVNASNNISVGSTAFVDIANLDFNLVTASAPINAGIDVGISNDFIGFIRDAQPDIGALEFNSGGGGGDITAPVLSNGAPSGEQSSGTTNTILSISTDENAFCKYSTTANTTYGSMINIFATTGLQGHSVSIGGLSDGVSYDYYVRCIDGSGNENTSDYTISFSVASGIPSSDPTTNPLAHIGDFEYVGGFTFGSTSGVSDLSYTSGKFAVNPASNSVFIASHTNQDALGEFSIPALSLDSDYNNLNNATQIQDFDYVRNRVLNPEAHDELGGMAVIGNSLLFHSYTYYDAGGTNVGTTSVVKNLSDLKNSVIDGIFPLAGRAHLISWASLIPTEWQTLLGGDYISGSSSSIPINSRSSMGPSAFAFQSDDLLNATDTNVTIPTTKLLDFGLSNVLAKTPSGWAEYGDWDLYNANGDNDLWTEDSGAEYGFIIPGTRTYATIGMSGMHESGGGYKITQSGATEACGGPCAYDPLDMYNYIWLWDVNDFLDVKNGLKQSYEVKPYQYGKFNTPFEYRLNGTRKNLIAGGSYDDVSNTLYLNLNRADGENHAAGPVILAYKINAVVDTTAAILSNGTPTGEQAGGTTNVNLALDTDENATCKYSTVANTVFTSMTNTFTTTGNTSHSTNVTGLTDGNSYTYYVRCIDGYLNENTIDYTLNFSVANTPDTTAPILSNGTPSGEQASGTSNVNLILDTDENATCRYSPNANTSYGAMGNTFTTTGNTTHTTKITGLTDGTSHTYYVRCMDGNSNATITDYTLNFSVANTPDTGAPFLSNGLPNGEQASGTTNVNLTLDTNEASTCKYSTVVNTTYSSMTDIFTTGTGGITHTANITGLTDGTSHAYYVRCMDTDSNENTIDYTINFSVATASTNSGGSSSGGSSSGGGGGGGGGGGSYIPTCKDEQLTCKLIPGSTTTYKWYVQDEVSCKYGKLGSLCGEEDVVELNSGGTGTGSSTDSTGGGTLKKYHSEMTILQLIEKRVDKVIEQKKKDNDDKVIEYRNAFIKDVENYILARQAKQSTREHKVKILATFKLFAKELKKDRLAKTSEKKKSTIKKYIAVHEAVYTLGDRLDSLIIKYNKESSIKVLFFKNKLLKSMDSYITTKKNKEKGINYKIKLKILKSNIGKTYKIFLKGLKS